MKALFRIALLSSLLILGACKPKPPEPTVFSPPDKSFTVMMLGTPTPKDHEANPAVNFKGGTTYELRTDGKFYMVGFFDYATSPPGMHSDSLDRFRDIFLKSSKGQLTSEESVMLDGNTGRELVVQDPSGLTTHVRIFIKEKRAYLVGVDIGKDADNQSPLITNYLNSFHIRED